jgi:hypothetical protein
VIILDVWQGKELVTPRPRSGQAGRASLPDGRLVKSVRKWLNWTELSFEEDKTNWRAEKGVTTESGSGHPATSMGKDSR